ncbi:MAG: hypothetical protein MRERC_1c154 [Mycoplasmataceae bacterium RC_NB112A]|nr:MAG: hypothetical protein MRERC_1c154 [Mycoplasmataceae bacterium RC_NB112A]
MKFGKKNSWGTRYEKFAKNKRPWRTLLGNLLLSNLIALVVSLVQYNVDGEVNWILNFCINNGVGLTVWLFNLFFPWE